MQNPLIERRDYGVDGKDALDKNFDELNELEVPLNKSLRSQFNKREACFDFEQIIKSVVSQRC